MNNKAHLRPQDYDSNGDIIPMACKKEKEDVFTRKEELSKEESEWLIDFITKEGKYGMTDKEILNRLLKSYQIYLGGDMKPVEGYDDTFYNGVLWAFARLTKIQPSDDSVAHGGYYICDNCGEVVEKNYCPNCGLRKVKK